MITLPILDQIAVAWFVVVIGGYRLVSERGPFRRRSIVAAVREQRLSWMRNMAARDNRMLDGIVLSSLHGRANTRLFAKPVSAGSSSHNLSEEETQAIRIAVEGTRTG